MNLIKKFIRDEEGVTAIEYGLIAALISVAIIAAVGDVATGIKDIFGQIAAKLSSITVS